MNNNEEKLKIVGIEIPDGGACLGTKVKLSNGRYLTGIRSLTLHADVDRPLWGLTIEVMPDFIEQETIDAVLESCKVSKSLKAIDRKEEILKQVEMLKVEYSFLSKYDETTNTQAETAGTENTTKD